MYKDPAFIFYASDFLMGVSNLTMEERGQYITLLCLQHQLGHLSKKTIQLNINNVSEDVLKKFEKDKNGNYYNVRLEYEINKRSKFIEHQKENGKKGGRPKKAKKKPNKTQNETQKKAKKKPLENENENENENINENINYKNIIVDIIDYLNFKTNKNYRHSTKNTQKVIKARMNEGFTLEDFKKVIDNQVSRWLNDKKMCDYLRPETLFGTKFESYLNNTPKEITTKDLASNIDYTDFLNEGRK